MVDFPRGIQPSALIALVQNTVPFLDQLSAQNPPVGFLLQAKKQCDSPLTHFEYFRLCLSAHWVTVASYVPTDVDNQIRSRLWPAGLDAGTIAEMVDLVEQSLSWEIRDYSTRYVESPRLGILSGHQGEWFSVAVAAYGASRRLHPELAERIADQILKEVEREAHFYLECRERGDGVSLLKAATAIAHNLGDLDRVIEQWQLPSEDRLVKEVFKAGHGEQSQRPLGRILLEVGEVNKAFMAVESHRHFPLRKPKCLRKSKDLLLPISPFLDDWGTLLARTPQLTREECGEVAEALIDGWVRLYDNGKGPVGYARALSGMERGFPGGRDQLHRYLPAKLSKTLKSGPLRQQVSVDQGRFEEQLSVRVLQWIRQKAIAPNQKLGSIFDNCSIKSSGGRATL